LYNAFLSVDEHPGDFMSVVRAGLMIGTISAGALIVGCAPKQKPTLVTPPRVANPPPRSATDLNARVSELSKAAQQLSADSRQLSGRNEAEQRRIMARVLDDLLRALPLLGDPQQNSVLRMQMSSIQNSRAQLQYGSADLSIEPSINTALRSASAALADMSHADFYDQATLGPMLDKLSAQVDGLDLDHGPLHSVDAAEAVDLTSQLVSKMADALGSRVKSTAATQPVQ
jgi:hypothetical protein